MPRGIGPLDHPDIHRKEVIDPAEKLVAQSGSVEEAMTELEKAIGQNPGDEELLRQANLIKNRAEDILRRAEELRKDTTVH
ncbi:MAG: hypothetical protein ACYC6X_01820 [Minisyncoccota bacterium]